ncbi:EmrB/QacA subfamily drug resistance transporter [Leucobacter exalbidus]|uniref:EmrB/QacA subfamily drug resistance transporter n=1 Tax=Leucobacter exalbidus TaxID=662960 RepID=A0A940PLG2_9MICO|nr:MDR family MFS transporter [Leucobacter exalbidus]MBP1326107.1 EmrB/QacA subfamily drug resistance transporter [Leucobacter exalbidus]
MPQHTPQATPAPRTSKRARAAIPDVLTGRGKTLALTGIFLASAVSMLSMTVVGTSMPVILADLGGDQAAFTWVVTATMLSAAVSTPIWGKLADLTSKKVLLQASLVLFTLGSVLAGTAGDPGWLIAFRVIQGLGAGGLGALGQIVLAEIISPRERGKYMGIMGAIMAVSTVGGPLLGGWITDSIGWRWNFYVSVPIAVTAIIVLQKTLHLRTIQRKITIDYWGAVLITAGFSSLLIWVTLGGTNFAWWSWQTAAMVGGGLAFLIAAVLVELKVDEPLIPLTLFKNRTFTLSVIASLAVGLAMFGTSVFLGQYMQLARGETPTMSGLLTIPMMAGVLISSTIAGQLITRTGKWKRYMVTGSVLLLAGMLMMGQLRYDTAFWYVGVSMFVLGVGVGLCMQNLVLVVQNTVDPAELGASTSAVTFFRTIGGTAGMSAMGAMLATSVVAYIKEGMQDLTPEQLAGAGDLATSAIPKLSELTEPIRTVVESAYGHGIGNVFLAASPVAILAICAIAFLPNIPLSTKSNAQKLAEQRASDAPAPHAPDTAVAYAAGTTTETADFDPDPTPKAPHA